MKTKTNTKTMTMTMKMTNTFREHLQRAISETFDLWDISSEWWENMTWPTKRQRQRQIQRQWQWQIHLEPSKSDLWDFWPFRHLIRVARKQDLANKKTTTKTMTMANTFGEHFQRAIFETKIICFFLEWSIDARSKFLDLVQSQNLNILLYEANIGRGGEWQSMLSRLRNLLSVSRCPGGGQVVFQAAARCPLRARPAWHLHTNSNSCA